MNNKSVIATLLALAVNQVLAEDISFNGYSHDTMTDIVVGGGIEWLRWSSTDRMSINDALEMYSPDEWELATNEQMDALFNAFGFGATFTWQVAEGAVQGTTNNDGDTEATDDPELVFTQMFGATYSVQDPRPDGSNHNQISAAFYGSDTDGDGLYKQAVVTDDRYNASQDVTLDGSATLHTDGISATYFDSYNGVALVRYIQAPIPALSCDGFFAPLNNGAVTVKKNRALPYKAELIDEQGISVADRDISSPPVIQVVYDSGREGEEPIDVTDAALSAGYGTDGNQFVYNTDDYVWQFNLKARNYDAAGAYTVSMVSGDETEYTVDETCIGQFVVK